MVETAIEVTGGYISASDIQAILRFGRAMLEHPVELIDGAREVLETLRTRDHQWGLHDARLVARAPEALGS